jgi:hypothetical protein
MAFISRCSGLKNGLLVRKTFSIISVSNKLSSSVGFKDLSKSLASEEQVEQFEKLNLKKNSSKKVSSADQVKQFEEPSLKKISSIKVSSMVQVEQFEKLNLKKNSSKKASSVDQVVKQFDEPSLKKISSKVGPKAKKNNSIKKYKAVDGNPVENKSKTIAVICTISRFFICSSIIF